MLSQLHSQIYTFENLSKKNHEQVYIQIYLFEHFILHRDLYSPEAQEL